MPPNLRVSLTIFSIGFAVDGSGEAYSVLSRGAFLPGTGLLLVLPTVMTLVGLLFVWIGRHEWNELHHARVRHAHVAFGLSILAGAVAGATVGVLAIYPSLGTPLWAEVVFGSAVGAQILGTFVTYVLLVFHLVTGASKAALVVALVWALGVSALIGRALSGDLPTILSLLRHRTFSAGGLLDPVNSIASYLFVTYFLLLAVYLDAHYTVAQGLEGSPPRPAPPTTVGTGP